MADGIEEFKEQYPSLESYWRSVILFGRNVASYKFALAKSLFIILRNGVKSSSPSALSTPLETEISRMSCCGKNSSVSLPTSM